MSFQELEGDGYNSSGSIPKWGGGGYASPLASSYSSSNSPFAANPYKTAANENDWDKLADDLQNNIGQFSTQLNAIQKNVMKLGTSEDTDQLRDNIKDRLLKVRELTKHIEDQKKRLKELESNAPDQKRRAVFNKLTQDWEKQLHQFSEVSKLWAKKSSSAPVRQPQYYNPNSVSQQAYYQEPVLHEEEHSLIPRDYKAYAEIDYQKDSNDWLIRERDQEIRDIEQGVVDVNEMFRDIAHLVQDQGQMIGTIEAHIESSVDNTNRGVRSLEEAAGHQKKASNKTCWIVVILVIVIAVLVGLAAVGISLFV